ncbi:tyrosine-type recombinase/integrase [Candidatus Halobonum tyrrellensis]|uniref:Integrase n=1 Tax=Candidatus Halobonum tyrrellensis G22 TaxID=1324957 RepID=V4GUV8_9EURY|nr:site-specific integrase [Candidatus Halobonum tyrrellensis]ESP88916.1 integrase [Candidatus Halobonum tyrrellensis G22]
MDRTEKGQFVAKHKLREHQDLYNDYGGWVETNREKSTTIERLKAGVKAWLWWCENNDVDPLSVDTTDIRTYIVDIRSQYADTTLTRQIASVSKYYQYLENDPRTGVNYEDNPVAPISLPKDYGVKETSEYVRVLHREGRNDIIALPKKTIEKMFKPSAIPGKNPATRTRNELIVRLAWQTACRADELSRMRTRKIDWNERDIEIRSSKLDPEDHPDLYYRHVWWEPDLDLLMRRWVDSHRAQFSTYADNSPYLFLSTHGENLKPSTISRIIKEAANNAGIQEPLLQDAEGGVKQWLVTAHRLRHSRISHLANEVDDFKLHFLRMMAGHANFDTTLGYVESNWESARSGYHSALRNT